MEEPKKSKLDWELERLSEGYMSPPEDKNESVIQAWMDIQYMLGVIHALTRKE